MYFVELQKTGMMCLIEGVFRGPCKPYQSTLHHGLVPCGFALQEQRNHVTCVIELSLYDTAVPCKISLKSHLSRHLRFLLLLFPFIPPSFIPPFLGHLSHLLRHHRLLLPLPLPALPPPRRPPSPAFACRSAPEPVQVLTNVMITDVDVQSMTNRACVHYIVDRENDARIHETPVIPRHLYEGFDGVAPCHRFRAARIARVQLEARHDVVEVVGLNRPAPWGITRGQKPSMLISEFIDMRTVNPLR